MDFASADDLSLEACQQRLQHRSLLPDERVALLCRQAELLLQRGRFAEAVSSSQQAMALQPTCGQAHLLEGRALSQLGRDQEAIAAFDRAAAHAARLDARYWSDRGDSERNLKHYSTALAHYEQALADSPDHFRALLGKSVVLGFLNRHNEALDVGDRALMLKPNSAEAWSSRAIVLVLARRSDEALESLNRAIDLDPKFDKAWNNRGIVLLRLGQEQEALKNFERAVALNTNPHEPWYAIAWLYQAFLLLKSGQFERAIACCDQALQYQPRSYPANFYRVICLTLTGKLFSHLTHASQRTTVLYNFKILFHHLKYRLLVLLGLIAVLAWGEGEWVERLKEWLPTILSVGIIALLVVDLWKNKTKFNFVWRTYFRSGFLTYVRALGILATTLTTYYYADAIAPPFLQWGWANLVFGQPGNILFQPFNLFESALPPGSTPSQHWLVAMLPSVSDLGVLATAPTAQAQSWPSLEQLFVVVFWLLLMFGIPFWARLEERVFRRGANSWGKITVRSIQFGLIHLIAGIPILGGFVLIVPGFLFACRYKYVHDRCLRKTRDPILAMDIGVIASTADHAVYNAILVTLVVATLLLL